MGNSESRVAKKWSKAEPDTEKCFFGFRPLCYYQIKTAYGEGLAIEHKNNKYWSEDIIVSKYLSNRKIESILSLCCGFGHVERRIISQLPGVKQCIGVDITVEALEIAKQRAREAGLDHVIDYKYADLNKYSWEESKYDLVIANGALHHLANIENVIRGIKIAMRENAILYANEHVGSFRQDFPARQLELINAIAYLIPPELRGKVGTPFRHSHRFLLSLHRLYNMINGNISVPNTSDIAVKSKIKKTVVLALKKLFKRKENMEVFNFGILHDSNKDVLLRTDPSECVSSPLIIPTIQKHFPKAEVLPYGGGILAYALDEKFYDNYDHNDPLHRKTLEMICKLESFFVDTNQVSIEHAIIIARKG